MSDSSGARRRETIKDYVDANSKSTLIALLVALCLGLVYWPLIALVWLGCVLLAPYQVRA